MEKIRRIEHAAGIRKCQKDYDLDIIVVNYNSTDYLLRCLESIHETLNGHEVNVIVQDNASDDGVERLAIKFPDVVLCRNPANLGFSKAVNLGLKMGTGPLVMLINPDTLVHDRFFDRVLKFMTDHPEVGILGPKILDCDGSVQGSARSFPNLLTAFFGRSSLLSRLFPKNSLTRKNLLSLDAIDSEFAQVDWVSGACMVVRRKAVEEGGLLDERFFLYWEDADWCRSLAYKGWDVVYYPDATITHRVGGSSEILPIRSLVEFHKSAYWLFTKYAQFPLSLLKPVVVCGLVSRFAIIMFTNILSRWIAQIKFVTYRIKRKSTP